ncbi:ribonuclease HI [Cellulophaga sp. E16_2]|uniref:ribonuclease HI n=1 Tax=Cellulophaga sp. E16_2 TaxID=2789297 RepID=UPI001A928A1B|nr:ribonuclease HI [Cellulophaga sp. E16_2]MBO0592879.1 ribonuclease HI [Cellulophaga sp. E16_2]
MKKWTEIPNIELYSDGGAEPNPGKGGYGVILCYKGKQKEFFESFKLTTNNRMELMGVITGLEKLKTKSNVQVYTDSKYVIDGITKGWAKKWKSNGWKKKKNGQAKAINSDLWARLLNVIYKHNVEFNWVKGHSGHTENERCDTLASYGIHSTELKEDNGYEAKKSNTEQKININTSNTNKEKVKVEKEGDNCRKCNEPVVKKTRKKTKKIKPNQTYYFEYILLCPSCKTMYLTEDAKREITTENKLFE